MSNDAAFVPGVDDVARVMKVRRAGPANPFIRFEKSEVEQSIPARFEKMVRLYPDRVAVTDGDTILTYDALNTAANRLADAIVDDCIDDRPVALLADHGVAATIGALGVLKSGHPLVPVDCSLPIERIGYILNDSQACLTVADGPNLRLLQQLPAPEVPALEMDAGRGAGAAAGFARLDIRPDALAYIVYTSGSTGRPKGVMHSHRGLLGICRGFSNFVRICPDDRHVQIARHAHIAGIAGMLRAVLNGAALLPFDITKRDFRILPWWLAHEQITIYHSPASMFRRMTSEITGADDFSSLRIVHLGSEPVHRADVEFVAGRFPAACLMCNMYGSTERGNATGCWIDTHNPISASIIPAGYPTDDVEILILDAEGRAAGPNQPGEVTTASDYMALGYWRQPELTDRVFLADPRGGSKRLYRTGDIGFVLSDGCLVLAGRKDDQVKVRGFRIEVAEVEDALLRLPAVSQAVVVARPDASGEQRLVAYLVARTHPTPTVSAIRQEISRTLPPYMIPAAVVFLYTLPLTATGKIDRRALPDPGSGRPELDVAFVAPRTPLEETLAAVWTQVLGIAPIGVNDNFFDLGGDSLKAARVVTRVSDLHGVSVTPAHFFESPTPAGLALAITQAQAAQMEHGEIERLLAEVEDTAGSQVIAGQATVGPGEKA